MIPLYSVVLQSLMTVTFWLLCWCGAKVNTPINPAPTHAQSWVSQQCHDETQSGSWCEGQTHWSVLVCEASVSCRLSRVMNISYGLVDKPLTFKNEWSAVQQPIQRKWRLGRNMALCSGGIKCAWVYLCKEVYNLCLETTTHCSNIVFVRVVTVERISSVQF